MSSKVTLKQVEQLAKQLTPEEQKKLVGRINKRLQDVMQTQTEEERKRREYAVQVADWLTECDQVAEQIEGEFDSAEDLRQIREERTSGLCFMTQ
jgi:hypothetical protein